ncbi:dj-1 family protein [Colletotrichum truncatum]|uniref:Dj-1 family protein n=1 Tax=Colletotrichum truncatum TaxID=5467 RepID=A0ACC3YYX9_COLTU|nr:dj-1 family protein [Colletotrichum truncatum]KAF6781117.1 dj-1 family protein [Colletotrichum truncatum]
MSFDLRKPNRRIHAGVILTKGITEMLDVAPFEFFAWTDKESLSFMQVSDKMKEDALDIELHWVTEDGQPAKMKSRAQIIPTDSFETCPPLDIALMGAHDATYKTSPAEVEFIRKTFDHCSAFITICGGAMPLLEAGVLAGKTATCPRPIFELMKKNVPVVNWLDKRWVRDGKLWTSNSLLNGTDLIRAFATETWGGRNGMVEAVLDGGHFPDRDVDFKDFKGVQHSIDSLPA